MQCSERTQHAIANGSALITQVDVILVKDEGSAFEDLQICARTIMRCAVETSAPHGYRAIDCARFDLADEIGDAWFSLSDMSPANKFVRPTHRNTGTGQEAGCSER